MSHTFDAICETHRVLFASGCPECNDQVSRHGATYVQCPGAPICSGCVIPPAEKEES